jgi:hypothetical protein
MQTYRSRPVRDVGQGVLFPLVLVLGGFAGAVDPGEGTPGTGPGYIAAGAVIAAARSWAMIHLRATRRLADVPFRGSPRPKLCTKLSLQSGDIITANVDDEAGGGFDRGRSSGSCRACHTPQGA